MDKVIICVNLPINTHAISFTYTIGVEKNNEDAKRNYYSSNHHDAAREILLTEARLEELKRGSCETKVQVCQF